MNGNRRTLLTTVGLALAVSSCGDSASMTSGSQALDGLSFTVAGEMLDDSIRGCDHDGILDSSERGRLRFTVTNTSQVDASDVTVEVSDADLLPATTTAHVDFIPAGTTVSPELEVELADGVSSHLSEVAFSISVGGSVIATETWSTLVQSDESPEVVADRHLCVNLPPVVNAGADQSVAASTLVTLHGTASDPDGETLNYQWRQRAGSSADMEDATTLTPHFTAPGEFAENRLVFELKATDSAGHETLDTVTIDVAAVEIPTKPPSKQPSDAPAPQKSGCHTGELTTTALLGLLLRRRQR